MKITEEEHRVYMSYACGGGFISQERCYEILNEGRTTKVNRSSHKEHYYKIKW